VNPLVLSLLVATAATACVAVLAIPLAYRMARARSRTRHVIDTALTLPLVLPPTVVGYFIVGALGSRGWIGRWFADTLGYSILFRVEGRCWPRASSLSRCCTCRRGPLSRAVEPELQEMAAMLGASRMQTFWHVSLPIALHGILSGVVLCFARALGEFGATVMVFGWQPGRLTMPIAIYSAYEQGNLARALPLVLALTGICFLLLVLLNRMGLYRGA